MSLENPNNQNLASEDVEKELPIFTQETDDTHHILVGNDAYANEILQNDPLNYTPEKIIDFYENIPDTHPEYRKIGKVAKNNPEAN